jgi:hypothetical protein
VRRSLREVTGPRHERVWPDPHVVLLGAVAIVLVAEYLRALVDPVPWFPLQVAVAAAALGLVWPRRDDLRLPGLLAVAFVLHVGWLLVRIHADFQSPEQFTVYAPQGQILLDGDYPRSEYPVGAVLLFAFEAALRGDDTHLVHSFAMVPFQLVAVVALWSLHTRWSPWFAAVVAFWPVNAWFWEFRFDLAPAASLLAGLALAWRGRWALAGAAISLGFLVKWTPGLALLPLLVYLVALRELRNVVRLVLGALAPLLVVYVPFLLWRPSDVLAAYSRQGDRSITDESVWHLPLLVLGLEGRESEGEPTAIPVEAPVWADVASVGVQLVALATVVWLSTRARTARGAIALAAMMPVVFLVSNRVFSVQWFALLLPVWALAAALLVESRRDAVTATALACGATLANALILPVPVGPPHAWELMSAARFGLGIALTVWLVVLAVRPATEAAAAAGEAALPTTPRSRGAPAHR